MRLFDVFSDNALFQASGKLTLRGVAEPGTNIFAKISGHNASDHSRAICNNDGVFEISFNTPSASYKKYEISVTDGNETAVLSNVMFGELWIASGQSNMALENDHMFESREFLESIKELDIRVFAQENGDDVFSLVPENETKGRWVSTLNPDDVMCVSACATAFCSHVLKMLADSGRDIPVGFINVSWGGTPICSWLPYKTIDEDTLAKDYLLNKGLIPNNEKQIVGTSPSVMFNRKIAPIRGVMARGMLWYQGEYDSFSEYGDRIYKHFLYLLHDSYAELFAVNKNDFKIVSSLIYPCNYTDSGDTNVGYLNDAFVEAHKEKNDAYLCVPIYDFPPSWWPLDTNHPIHPLHKYALGERMAEIVLRKQYGFNGELPSLLRSYHIENDRIILTFDNTEKGLHTSDNKHIRGMYIAGSDNVYLNADCEILSSNEIAVFHPYLKNPCHCLYGWSSHEACLNLFSGDFPVLPFATDNNGTDLIKVNLKSFLNHEVKSELEWFEDSKRTGEWYYRPVWKPLENSDVCYDNAFSMRTEGYDESLAAGSFDSKFGIYTTAHDGHIFDFQNYSSLEVDIFHIGDIEFNVILDYYDGKGIKIAANYLHDSSMYFKHYSVDFTCIPDGEISKMTFIFEVCGNKIYKHINIGKIYLKPKN